MKIGIITIQKSPNYGGSLQSFALFQFLKNKGYECEVIDLLRPINPGYIESSKYSSLRPAQVGIKQRIKNFLGFKKPNVQAKYSDEFNAKMDTFNKRINFTVPYKSVDLLYSNCSEYDIYLTGSDQVWNPTMQFSIEPYFLTFAPNGARKISYGSSLGITNLRENEKVLFAKWLSDYENISVREQTAVEVLRSFVNKKINRVLDPTFLLNKEEWLSICKPPKKKGYLLFFSLTFHEDFINYGLELSRQSGLELIYLCRKQPDTNKEYKIVRDASPEEFLGYIKNAECVITDSFHATVFSIQLGTSNFFSYIPKTAKRGSRITDVLSLLGIENHVLDDYSATWEDLSNRKLKHDDISIRVNEEAEKSRNYLLESINNKHNE